METCVTNIREGFMVKESLLRLRKMGYDFDMDPCKLFEYAMLYGDHIDWLPFIKKHRHKITDNHIERVLIRTQHNLLPPSSALWLLVWKNATSAEHFAKLAFKSNLISKEQYRAFVAHDRKRRDEIAHIEAQRRATLEQLEVERKREEEERKLEEDLKQFLIEMFDIEAGDTTITNRNV